MDDLINGWTATTIMACFVALYLSGATQWLNPSIKRVYRISLFHSSVSLLNWFEKVFCSWVNNQTSIFFIFFFKPFNLCFSVSYSERQVSEKSQGLLNVNFLPYATPRPPPNFSDVIKW